MTQRLQKLFRSRRQHNRCALATYVTAGDPDLERSLQIVHTLIESGSDIVELGYPFSDPILDGVVIQKAHARSLRAGTTLTGVLNLVERIRTSNQHTPIVLMGYFNPIFAVGSTDFVHRAARAGVDALIVADLPMKEASEELLPALVVEGMSLIPLSAPGLEAQDLLLEEPGVGGFLYCIPSAGPTGKPVAAAEVIRREVDRCRERSTLPIGVGFGIQTPESAACVARIADAAIVGTALVSRIAEWVHDLDGRSEVLMADLGSRVRQLRLAIDCARDDMIAGPSMRG